MPHNAVTEILTNRYFVALGVPGLLMAAGVIAKKVVRGPGWLRQDFFLGVDLALAGLSAALIHAYDVIGQWTVGVPRPEPAWPAQELKAAISYLAVCVLAFMLVVALHQDQEQKPKTRVRQFFWLGVFTNCLGAGLLAGFIVFIKGVQG